MQNKLHMSIHLPIFCTPGNNPENVSSELPDKVSDKKCPMALLKVICWALIFIIRIR